MVEPDPLHKLPFSARRMIREVGVKQERIARGREQKNSMWSSIAILGVVGWSVTVPTVVGAALGIWLDRRWPGRLSWAMTLLMAGLAVGCINAWLHINGDHHDRN
jgi:ATP synthase protein I